MVAATVVFERMTDGTTGPGASSACAAGGQIEQPQGENTSKRASARGRCWQRAAPRRAEGGGAHQAVEVGPQGAEAALRRLDGVGRAVDGNPDRHFKVPGLAEDGGLEDRGRRGPVVEDPGEDRGGVAVDVADLGGGKGRNNLSGRTLKGQGARDSKGGGLGEGRANLDTRDVVDADGVGVVGVAGLAHWLERGKRAFMTGLNRRPRCGARRDASSAEVMPRACKQQPRGRWRCRGARSERVGEGCVSHQG